jgi:hypothetical protein
LLALLWWLLLWCLQVPLWQQLLLSLSQELL